MGQRFAYPGRVGEIVQYAGPELAGAVIQDVDTVVAGTVGGAVGGRIDNPLALAVVEFDPAGHRLQRRLDPCRRNAHVAILILPAAPVLQQVSLGFIVVDDNPDLIEDAQGAIVDRHGIHPSQDRESEILCAPQVLRWPGLPRKSRAASATSPAAAAHGPSPYMPTGSPSAVTPNPLSMRAQ